MYIHTVRYLRISPKKLTIKAKPVIGMKPDKAMEFFSVQKTKGAKILLSAVGAAINNARQENESIEDSVIISVSGNKGPSFKRHFIGARGRSMAKIKSTTHLSILFGDSPKKKKKENKSKKGKR